MGCSSSRSLSVIKQQLLIPQDRQRLRGFRHLAKVIEGVDCRDGIDVIEDSKAEDAR